MSRENHMESRYTRGVGRFHRRKETAVTTVYSTTPAVAHRHSLGMIVKIMHVFRFFESLLEPTAIPTGTAPPAGLGAFYWHYARQARRLVAALFVAGFIVAILDTTIPVFIGRVVTLGLRPRAGLAAAR